MKGNLKKIKIVIFLTTLLNFSCISCSAQRVDKSFNNYLDNRISSGRFVFFEINFLKKCNNNKFLFSLAEMNYNDNIPKRHKLYMYKNVLIVYDIDESEKDLKVINFFNSHFKEVIYDISILPKGNQSLVNATALYFENNKFINDDKEIKAFMENNCN